jgi:hypothetical protein
MADSNTLDRLKNVKGNTPAHKAVVENNLAALHLIVRNDEDFNAENPINHLTPMDYAFILGYSPLFGFLSQVNAKFHSDCKVKFNEWVEMEQSTSSTESEGPKTITEIEKINENVGQITVDHRDEGQQQPDPKLSVEVNPQAETNIGETGDVQGIAASNMLTSVEWTANVKGNKTVSSFQNKMKQDESVVKDAVQNLGNKASEVANAAKKAFHNVENEIRNDGQAFVETVKNKVKSIVDSVKDPKALPEELIDLLKKTFPSSSVLPEDDFHLAYQNGKVSTNLFSFENQNDQTAEKKQNFEIEFKNIFEPKFQEILIVYENSIDNNTMLHNFKHYIHTIANHKKPEALKSQDCSTSHREVYVVEANNTNPLTLNWNDVYKDFTKHIQYCGVSSDLDSN